jgi:hypothetical protein
LRNRICDWWWEEGASVKGFFSACDFLRLADVIHSGSDSVAPYQSPPHLKVKRAKVFVDDAGIRVLTECKRFGKEKYIVEGQTVCDECR